MPLITLGNTLTALSKDHIPHLGNHDTEKVGYLVIIAILGGFFFFPITFFSNA